MRAASRAGSPRHFSSRKHDRLQVAREMLQLRDTALLIKNRFRQSAAAVAGPRRPRHRSAFFVSLILRWASGVFRQMACWPQVCATSLAIKVKSPSPLIDALLEFRPQWLASGSSRNARSSATSMIWERKLFQRPAARVVCAIAARPACTRSPFSAARAGFFPGTSVHP